MKTAQNLESPKIFANQDVIPRHSAVQVDPVRLVKYMGEHRRYSEVSFKEANHFKCNKEIQKKKVGITFRLVIVAVTGLLTSALPAGYNIGVVNTPQTILKEFVNASLSEHGVEMNEKNLEFLWSLVVSLLLVGSVIGAGLAGWIADRLGRRNSLLLNSSIGLVAAALFPLSNYLRQVHILIIGRFIAGIHCGIASSLVPIYLMEVAPKPLKRAMGVMQVLGLCLGILIAQILGQEELLGTRMRWPILLSFSGFFIAFGLVALIFCPESPTYLYIIRGKEEKAVTVLQTLRKLSVKELEEDILDMRVEQKLQEANEWSFTTLFTLKSLRLPVFLVCILHIGQQLIGINAVFYYSTMTFQKAGLTMQQSQYGSIGAAAINALMSVIAVPLVNKYSRKVLLMVSTVGATICLLLLTISMRLQHISWMPFVTITAFMCFVAVYGLGLGPIPYMIGSELFEQSARSSGMSLGCLTNWLTNFIIAITFPILQSTLHEYVFLIFACFGFILIFIIHFKLPETSDKQFNSKV